MACSNRAESDLQQIMADNLRLTQQLQEEEDRKVAQELQQLDARGLEDPALYPQYDPREHKEPPSPDQMEAMINVIKAESLQRGISQKFLEYTLPAVRELLLAGESPESISKSFLETPTETTMEISTPQRSEKSTPQTKKQIIRTRKELERMHKHFSEMTSRGEIKIVNEIISKMEKEQLALYGRYLFSCLRVEVAKTQNKANQPCIRKGTSSIQQNTPSAFLPTNRYIPSEPIKNKGKKCCRALCVFLQPQSSSPYGSFYFEEEGKGNETLQPSTTIKFETNCGQQITLEYIEPIVAWNQDLYYWITINSTILGTMDKTDGALSLETLKENDYKIYCGGEQCVGFG